MAENVIEFQIKGDVSGATKAFGSLDDVLAKAAKGLTILGAAYAAVEVVKFIGQQIEVADQMGKMALKSGVAVEAFSQMSHAFALSDVSAEELAGGFKFLNKAIDEAKQGNDAAQKSFESIGISMANLKNDSPNEIMLKMADAFTQIEDPAARNTMLLEKFGRAGLKLAPAMEDGRAGIEKLMKQADALGLTVDKEFAAAADRFGDSLQTIGAAADGTGRRIGKMLLPILQEVIDALFSFEGTTSESIVPWGKVLVTVVGVVSQIFLGLIGVIQTVQTIVFGVIKQAIQGLMALNDALVMVLSGQDGALDRLATGWEDMGKTGHDALAELDRNAIKTGTAINNISESMANYGKSVAKAGDITKEAAGHKLDPVSKEAATRLEALRVSVLSFISTMDKATADSTGNKLAGIDAWYNAQLDAINNLAASEAQNTEMLLALNTNYTAQRIALNDSMLAQMGMGNDAYRARQAELIAQDAALMVTAGVSEIDALNFKNASLLQLQANYLSAKNSALGESYMTQDEITAARDEAEVLRLETAYANKLIGEDAFNEAMRQRAITSEAALGGIHAQTAQAQLDFDKMAQKQKIQATADAFGAVAALMQSGSKEGFRIGKAAAIAQAVINTYTAATGAYASASAIPVVGWILGPLAAVAAIALGMKNVQQIRSQQMGQAHAGMSNIPSEGSYLLDKGERVIQPEQNKDLTRFLAQGDSGGGGGVQVGNISIEILVPSGEALKGMTRREWEDIATDRIIPALNVLDRKGVRPDFVQRYDK